MRHLARICGLAGVLIAAFGIIGRFKGPATVCFHGDQFAASSVLLTANTFLLLAVLLSSLGRRD